MRFAAALLVALVLCGCGPRQSVKVKVNPTVPPGHFHRACSSKIRIAVADFSCKAKRCEKLREARRRLDDPEYARKFAGKRGPEFVEGVKKQLDNALAIGSQLADMMTGALARLGTFTVLERQGLPHILREIDLSQIDSLEPGMLESADLLVVGVITQLDPGDMGWAFGVPILIPGSDFLGGIGARYKKASITADVRVIECATGRIAAAFRVSGSCSAWDTAVAAGTLSTPAPAGGHLTVKKTASIERAMQLMVDAAAQKIRELICQP